MKPVPNITANTTVAQLVEQLGEANVVSLVKYGQRYLRMRRRQQEALRKGSRASP